jgi:hypothetical protein
VTESRGEPRTGRAKGIPGVLASRAPARGDQGMPAIGSLCAVRVGGRHTPLPSCLSELLSEGFTSRLRELESKGV